MKKLIIKQKFFSFHDRFQIQNEDGSVAFFAQNQLIRLWNNMAIMDPYGNTLYTLKSKFFFIFSKYKILKGNYDIGNEVGLIKERFGFFFRRARVITDMPNVWIKSGPIHLKAYLADKDWQIDKSAPVVLVTKKLLKIADTYTIEYDETKIPASLAAIIGLWYDMLTHSEQH